ncbi:hypothetical protein FZEAL_8319 [Fusarium zealandicum]|uniref:Uncharacterized protein n=1 Tax=Fusarium zealandicum TaxID=1053134 RepID=A0A8H4UEL0_9HYPO|nr:hypothetical protein FZEAL_8319 [Fusarium zealandicum]
MEDLAENTPWRQRSEDGSWAGPLVGPEKMFGAWLELDGWAEHIASITFRTVPSMIPQTPEAIEGWFRRAASSTLLENPSLMAHIDRTEGSPVSARNRAFIYNPVMGHDDLAERTATMTTVISTETSTEDGIKSITDYFYAHPD